jgi:hypothetical protein
MLGMGEGVAQVSVHNVLPEKRVRRGPSIFRVDGTIRW